MMHFHIVVPAPVPTGPIKGAYALANALVRVRPVTVVVLKKGPGADTFLHPTVEFISLAKAGWNGKISAYRRLLRRAGGREAAASISLCLSADFVNLFCADIATTCSSVRANLFLNYRHDYGRKGLLAAAAHLMALRRMHYVTVMSEPMRQQVEAYIGYAPPVIANFVDETVLDQYGCSAPPQGPLRFIFVGSLTTRKQPRLLIRAIAEMRLRGIDARLEVVGEGPLRTKLIDDIEETQLRDHVVIHGFRREPYSVVAAADVFVLPSLSEGMSRACLEALHLGVPCVLRAVDGNAEVINTSNGRLFEQDDDLADAMLQAAQLSRSVGVRSSLLPEKFRQLHASEAYRELLENEARGGRPEA